MKKSLIALAALGALSGAAQAQSSVTLYGRVDLGLASVKSIDVDSPTRADASATKIDNGNATGLTGSRWGMRGTEDLGGGLKAMFKLENRFSADTGAVASSSSFFNGESFVALGGGFGTVKLGRTYTSLDDVRALAVIRSLWDSAFTPTGDVYGRANIGTTAKPIWIGGADYASRSDNNLRYESPKMSGFSAGFSYGLGENKTATQSASHILSLGLMYAGGPLSAALGYQDETAVGGKKVKFNAISAAYDFGVVAVSGGFNGRNGNETNTGKDQEFTLGVNVPMGAINLSAGIAGSKTKINGNTTAKGRGVGLGATYSLSKRTTAYTGLKSTQIEDGAGVKKLNNRLFSVGVRHDF